MESRKFSPERLLATMERLGVSRRELSRRVNPGKPENARSSLNKHLNGRPVPEPTTIARYAAALDVSVQEITVPDPLAARIRGLRERQDARRAA